MSEFQVTKTIKAVRKQRLCEHCESAIAVGSPAVAYKGVWDGEFGVSYMHPDCHALGEAYAKETGYWGDEWTWLHTYAAEEPKEVEAWRSEYPEAVARLLMRAQRRD